MDEDHDRVRPYPARAGIAALNLIIPGLGLLRLGKWRPALFFIAAPFVLLPSFSFGLGRLPITSYDRAAAAAVIAFALVAVMLIAPIILTWRSSRLRSPLRKWSQWYGLTAISIVVIILFQPAEQLMQYFYKGFYLPSESMAPTLARGDKIVVDMRWRGPIRRGEIIVFRGPDSVRVSRIAALPGDRIGMRGGVPVLNGTPVLQAARGRAVFTGYDGLRSAALLNERLPGEPADHRVLDAEASEFDDTKEAVVPPGHVFVLGDNRDRSADSRVPPELRGVGMVPLTAIIGRPTYIYWSGDHARIGTRLDR